MFILSTLSGISWILIELIKIGMLGGLVIYPAQPPLQLALHPPGCMTTHRPSVDIIVVEIVDIWHAPVIIIT